MLRLFQNKNFRRLFFGNLLSGIGQGMTMIGGPWYLARHYPTAHVLGMIMIATSIVNLAFGPYAGALIDRHNRRTVVLVENIVGFAGLGAMALLGLVGDYSLIAIGGIYMFTVMIFNVHFPATIALVQESFPRELYGPISGMMEVITQTAAIVAGGLTGLILDSVGLPLVFAIDSITYGMAFLLLQGIHYEARVGVVAVKSAFVNEMRTAARFLQSRPYFTLLNFALYCPFIALISLEIIHPFYVQQTLHAQAKTYSLLEGFYAGGATAAGLWMRRFAGTIGHGAAYVTAYALFICALLFMAALPVTGVALGAMTCIGWCNAGIRVNRVTFVMQEVPAELSGRVNTFFNWTGGLLRILVMLVLTWSVDALGPQWSYAIDASVLASAFALFLFTRHKAQLEHATRNQ